jgi:hypothetical protein
MVSFRVDEDDFVRLDALAHQTSCSRAEVLRRCLRSVRLKSTTDAQALTEVSRVHADLNRIGGLLKLAIRGRSAEPRATWFLAANLPGVTTTDDLELALTPLRSMAREREKLPRRAADCEAHQGIDSFARWARKTLAPALRATPLRTWDEVHDVCGRFGVVLRLHGNGLVFEDAERGVRVKASSLGREFSKPRLCKQLGDFRRASAYQLEASRHAVQPYSPMPSAVPQSLWKDYIQSLEQARLQRQEAWGGYRDAASWERHRLKQKYRQRRGILAALPVSGRDRKSLSRQLALRRDG